MRRAHAGAILLCAGALGFACAAEQAQAVLVGTYKGAAEVQNAPVRGNPRPRMLYVELEITSVEGNKITGNWVHLNGRCKGRVPVAGKLRDDGRLTIVRQPAPGQEICGPPRLRFAIEDGALVGKFSGGIRLTR